MTLAFKGILRCSSLDMLFACPPSVLDQEQKRIASRDYELAANLGKAVHFLCASHIDTGSYEMDVALARHGLDSESQDELISLMSYAERAWKELEKFFPSPQTECAMKAEIYKGLTLHGTADCVSFADSGKGAVFIDWKSGYLDSDYTHQLHGYAYCLWSVMGKPADISISGVVVFLRHRYYRTVTFTADSLKDWEYDLTHNVLPKIDTYRPGNQCAYCELSTSCEARQVMAQSTLKAMMFGVGDNDSKEYTNWLDKASKILAILNTENKTAGAVAEIVSDMLFRIKLAEQAAERSRRILKEAVLKAGPIPLGDGDVLALRPIERRAINAESAFPVLRKMMSDKQLSASMSLSLTKIKKQICDVLPQKQRVDACKRLEEDIADSIEITQFERLEIMKAADIETGDDNAK